LGTKRTLTVRREHWSMRTPIRISGRSFSELACVVVEIDEAGRVGRGEAAGVYYLDDRVEDAVGRIEALTTDIEQGLDRATLQRLLPAGGARNALDCALWDLECKLGGQTIWERAGATPHALTTCCTIGVLPSPADTGRAAAALNGYRLLKLKLDSDRPIDRVRAVRAARPDARLIVDANQGFTLDLLKECLPEFAKCEIELVEQPLPRGEDEGLEGLAREVPICADESCLHRGELDAAARRYDVINIKLDKAGGLTESLLLADDILTRGLSVMVGNMLGTSLAMAPAYVVALKAKFADLDGPLALRSDRPSGLAYQNGTVQPFSNNLWG
jgi:L-alanine-DL-glutamate epimerase-like enolase superfamily enzyme